MQAKGFKNASTFSSLANLPGYLYLKGNFWKFFNLFFTKVSN
jgi:hypothetical protein